MAALIGFLGVIVGALVTGAVGYRIERRRLLDVARVAARLIGVELDAAIRKLSAADSAQALQTPVIATQEWEQRGPDLIAFLDRARPAEEGPETRPSDVGEEDGELTPLTPRLPLSASVTRYVGPAEKIASAYNTIGIFNRDELPEPDISDEALHKTYSDAVERLSVARTVVHHFLTDTRPRLWGRRVIQGLAIVLILVVLGGAVLLGYALSASRTYETDASVAASLADAIPGTQAVQCSGLPGEAWQCTSVNVNARRACGASFSSHPRTQRVLAASCKAKGSKKTFKVAKQGAKLVAAETARALFNEEGDVYTMSPAQRKLWKTIWEKIGG
jgi:hypothetical protein